MGSIAFLTLLLLSAGASAPASPNSPRIPGDEPPARGLSRELCSNPRLAGTRGSLRAAHWVATKLEQAGFRVELDRRVVLLSMPRRLELRAWAGEQVLLQRIDRFDAHAVPPGDVPRFNAWSASARVEAGIVLVGKGLRADYDRLASEGVEVAGRIALAQYGGSYRGVKAELAEEYGCAGLLLYSDPAGDGPDRGPVYPAGPWKPGWAAQRGSISPLAHSPGDPSTPGWASPAPGQEGRRLSAEESALHLPHIPCLPIGSSDAQVLIERAAEVRVLLDLDVPRELYTIVNVIARLPGETSDFVIAGNHRDAWVRGAHDAGSGTISLLRAAQHLGERVRAGWKPRNGLVLGFWDAEEFGLIGSTEWAEANAERLVESGLVYVNADSVVTGLHFGASGTPGLVGSLQAALEEVPMPAGARKGDAAAYATVWDDWSRGGERTPSLGLPGSGSDYTVFLHHLGLPILDMSMGGGTWGGQYHTSFDDFAMVDRFLDPTWEGHETAGAILAAILGEFCDAEGAGFDAREAARAMAAMVRRVGEEEDWLGAERAQRLATALDTLVTADVPPLQARNFYRALAHPTGLGGRPWFKNRLWAPGLETGYASERLPALRSAAHLGAQALERELSDLIAAVERLRVAWQERESSAPPASAAEIDRNSGR